MSSANMSVVLDLELKYGGNDLLKKTKMRIDTIDSLSIIKIDSKIVA